LDGDPGSEHGGLAVTEGHQMAGLKPQGKWKVKTLETLEKLHQVDFRHLLAILSLRGTSPALIEKSQEVVLLPGRERFLFSADFLK